MNKLWGALISLLTVAAFFLGVPCAYAAKEPVTAKVLVVMSYGSSNSSEIEIRKGIEEVLVDDDIRYFYMDTKKYPAKGPQKAAETFKLYRDFAPNLVITVDDNAQSMFVLPYLKGKEKVPVVFCGVNDEAGKYGFPTPLITGILEKKHYRQSIIFARQLDPTIRKIAVIYKDNTSNRTNVAQIKKEQSQFGVDITSFTAIASKKELLQTMTELEDQVDALLVLNMSGITDGGGGRLGQKETYRLVADRWPKPTIGASKKEIKYGLLCAIAKSNKEQGQVAGGFAMEILNGTPVSEIPLTENRNGQRIINVSTVKKIGLKLRPMHLIGTELVQ